MNPTIVVALIGAVALVIVALLTFLSVHHQIRSNELIAGVADKIDGVGKNVDLVVHSVNSTQQAILVELQRLNAESAGYKGQLQERDRTEARADAQAEKINNAQTPPITDASDK
jgi:hypothetical protein